MTVRHLLKDVLGSLLITAIPAIFIAYMESWDLRCFLIHWLILIIVGMPVAYVATKTEPQL